jgi:hypothetical protein
MNRYTMTAVVVAWAVAGCGGTSGEVETTTTPGLVSTLSALSAGATVQRAYVGVDDDLTLAGTPVLATMDLVGGAQIDLEVVTQASTPIRFEVWTVSLDGTAVLQMPVDAPSGFALESIRTEQDGMWAIRFEGEQRADVIVHMDCLGGTHGCAQFRQPGQTCPAGWTCDLGLECDLPVGVCGPLDGIGTCVERVTTCSSDGAQAVCGCDGRTYTSECEARLAQVPILQTGPCSGGTDMKLGLKT